MRLLLLFLVEVAVLSLLLLLLQGPVVGLACAAAGALEVPPKVVQVLLEVPAKVVQVLRLLLLSTNNSGLSPVLLVWRLVLLSPTHSGLSPLVFQPLLTVAMPRRSNHCQSRAALGTARPRVAALLAGGTSWPGARGPRNCCHRTWCSAGGPGGS